MIAQQVIGHFDLGGPGRPPYELVASTEPCIQCFGALTWSGVRRLACGARDEDAREIGFDEGPKMEDWVSALERRGISVVRDVCREQAAAVLGAYAEGGGKIVLGQNNYGKSEIRLLKVRRDAERQELWDLDVRVALEGDFEAAHTRGDNSGLLAT